ncbi:DUF3365 domain-containing protein, partial [bacterium]|nr:DUF3365 domain-containing protein [bacterium]
SKPIAQSFGKTLKTELKKALGESGPTGAIEVCKTISKKTEEEFTKKYPDIIRLRRVSTKPRHPEIHTPTQEEEAWLQTRQRQVENGESATPGVLVSAEKATVLFPIVIDSPLCLTCHGDIQHMPDDFKNTLKTNYPNDKATGYEQGDFRGAVAIEWEK